MGDLKDKARRNVWPWVIISIVVLALLAWLVIVDDDVAGVADDATVSSELNAISPDEEVVDGTATIANPVIKVEKYISFVESHTDQLGSQSGFASQGLAYLADIFESMINETRADEVDNSIDEDIDELKSMAVNMGSDPTPQAMSNAITQAAQIFRSLEVQGIEENVQPASADDLLQAAQQVRDDIPLEEQAIQIRNFFTVASLQLEDRFNLE